MTNDMQLLIDKLTPEIIRQSEGQKALNRAVNISGERFTIELEGRNIDIAYYRASVPDAPLIVGLHGGGFLFGGSALDDDLWKNVRDYLNMNIASINYRQSPDVMDYESLYDVYDSILYLKDHADKFGFNRDHISVFGSSAGGNLAAATAILAKRRGDLKLEYQILMYPFLDGYTDPDSKGEGSFSGAMPHIMNKLHFTPENAADPLLSPIFADTAELTGLPTAIVSYCEYDNLRAEAVSYCNKLRSADVNVYEFFAAKMPHGYIENGFKDHFTDNEIKFFIDNRYHELIEKGLLRNISIDTLAFISDSIKNSKKL